MQQEYNRPFQREMTTLTPPWGLGFEGKSSTAGCARPLTRTEMIRSRREKEAAFAQNMMPSGDQAAESQVVVPPDWWKLVKGYRENPYDDLASSPRFQRYMKRRAKAHTATEGPDPFSTHEVRLRKPSRPCTEKVSSAKPPPADAEAYFAPKRTINKQFTGEFLTWRARLISHGHLDERGKSLIVTRDECMPPYSSLASSFTGCNIDSKNNIRSPRQARVSLRGMAPHPLQRPSAVELARKAIKQRRIMWKGILASTAGKPRRKSGGSGGGGGDVSAEFEEGSRPASASSASPKDAAARDCGETQIRPPSAPPESNRRRYSRLCGQG